MAHFLKKSLLFPFENILCKNMQLIEFTKSIAQLNLVPMI